MNDRVFFISFLFFVFFVYFIHHVPSLSGKVIDVSSRFCRDSDDGLRPYTVGYIKSDIGTFNDRCVDNLHQIREYYCDEGHYGGRYLVSSTIVACGPGYACVRDVFQHADSCVKS